MTKIERFWGNATADDVLVIANTRKPIQARVRDEDSEVWREVLISGWRLSRFLSGTSWIDGDGVHWKQCQVYREPSWWTNKPDPGPGWRLLGKFPDEELKPGDECLGVYGEWEPSYKAKTGGHQVFDFWYRRRIEPVEPEPRPILTDWQCREGDTYRHPNGLRLAITAKGFEVTQ